MEWLTHTFAQFVLAPAITILGGVSIYVGGQVAIKFFMEMRNTLIRQGNTLAIMPDRIPYYDYCVKHGSKRARLPSTEAIRTASGRLYRLSHRDGVRVNDFNGEICNEVRDLLRIFDISKPSEPERN